MCPGCGTAQARGSSPAARPHGSAAGVPMLKPHAALPVSHGMLTNDARVALSPVSGGLVAIKLGGARRRRCAVQARCPNRLSSDEPFAVRPRANPLTILARTRTRAKGASQPGGAAFPGEPGQAHLAGPWG